MKSVISDMFSPLLSLHLYSFFHFILSHFPHCLITFIFPLPFSTLSHFSLFLSTFTFISLFLYFPISFIFLSISIISFFHLFPFPFFLSQISRNSFISHIFLFIFHIFHISFHISCIYFPYLVLFTMAYRGFAGW
jgi:hypothetical protein